MGRMRPAYPGSARRRCSASRPTCATWCEARNPSQRSLLLRPITESSRGPNPFEFRRPLGYQPTTWAHVTQRFPTRTVTKRPGKVPLMGLVGALWAPFTAKTRPNRVPHFYFGRGARRSLAAIVTRSGESRPSSFATPCLDVPSPSPITTAVGGTVSEAPSRCGSA